MDVDLFYTAGSAEFRDAVARRLEGTFGVRVRDRGRMEPAGNAYVPRRRQHDAYVLLDYMVRCLRSEAGLWIVDRDIFCENVNFVFGLAMYHIAAVVSTFRLDSPGMVVKEAVHEMGHVMGLQHCSNSCVMRFSDTYEDALRKPDTPCGRCRSRLNRKVIEAGQRM
jgi:archaemetzincin